MHLSLPCMHCFQDQGGPDGALYRVEVQDVGPYRLECRRGHRTSTVLQEQRFEVLSGVAANAIVDGYYREAVASFTAAQERFQEFFIRVICKKNGIDPREVSSAWKAVNRQSERQLGAFIFLYLLETGRSPAMLSNSLVSFRNEVIHQGTIPSRRQAMEYGQAVLDIVAPTLACLKAQATDHVGAVILEHMAEAHRIATKDDIVCTMTAPMPISLSRSSQSLEESVRHIVQMRSYPHIDAIRSD